MAKEGVVVSERVNLMEYAGIVLTSFLIGVLTGIAVEHFVLRKG